MDNPIAFAYFAAGIGAGLVLGYAWSQISCDVIGEALGWVIQYRPDPMATLAVAAGAIATSLIASLGPALFARPQIQSVFR